MVVQVFGYLHLENATLMYLCGLFRCCGVMLVMFFVPSDMSIVPSYICKKGFVSIFSFVRDCLSCVDVFCGFEFLFYL